MVKLICITGITGTGLCIVKFSKKWVNESAHLTEEVENTDSVQYVLEPGLLSCHETILM